MLGPLEIKIPKLRSGYFDASPYIGRYNRVDTALIATCQELYDNGISTRKITRLMDKLGVYSLSPTTISNMVKELDSEIAEFQASSLKGVELSYVWLDGTKQGQKIVLGLLKKVFEASNPKDVRARYHATIDIVEKISDAAAQLMVEAELDVLNFLNFPKEHTIRIRTNNVCERLNKEVKRQTSSVQIFPNKAATLRLCGAQLMESNELIQQRAFISSMVFLSTRLSLLYFGGCTCCFFITIPFTVRVGVSKLLKEIITLIATCCTEFECCCTEIVI